MLRHWFSAALSRGVFHGPGLDVDGQHLAGAQHFGHDGQDARAGAHVQHAQAFVVHVELVFYHQGRGFVVASAEGHARHNDDVVVHAAGLGVKRRPHRYLLGNDEGLKVLFPLGVPVLAGDDAVAVVQLADAGVAAMISATASGLKTSSVV